MSAKEKKAQAKKNNMQKVLKYLKEGMGIISYACDKAGISRQSFYNYLEDEEFAQEVHNISEEVVDRVESKLLKQINEDNLSAIIFYLKTKGKSRGFVQKNEVGVTDKSGNDVQAGNVTYVFGNSDFVDEFNGNKED